MFITISSYWLIFLLKFCGGTTRIVNGTDALESYRFMVSIQTFSKFSCGGTVLNRDHVLTAAHCVCDDNLQLMDISVIRSLDNHLNSSMSIKFQVKDRFCHKYDRLEFINDIAILKLSFPIPDPFYEKVNLALKTTSTKTESNGVILGWGRTFTDGPIQNILQQVDVIIYNDTTCESSWNGIRNIEYHICAGSKDNGRGSCQGDSGGPLLTNGLQIGIVSFGASGDCAISNETMPKIFTRISSYLNWINLNSNSSINFDDEDLTVTTDLTSKLTSDQTTDNIIDTTTKSNCANYNINLTYFTLLSTMLLCKT